MATPEQQKGGMFPVTTRDRTGVPVPVRKPPAEPAPVPSEERRKPPPKKRLGLYFRLVTAFLAMSAIGTAVQHHVQKGETLNPSGIISDIGGIPPTAEGNIDALARMAGWNIRLERPISPYDPDSTKAQEIKAGPDGNAIPATPQQIQEFINQIPPVFEKPPFIIKPNGDVDFSQSPTIKVILSMNPENAKSLRIENNITAHTGIYKDLYIKGDNVPFYLPLIEGAKKADVKTTINVSGITSMIIRYYLKDGQIIKGRIGFSDNNFITSDILKSIPTYDAKDFKTSDFTSAPGKEFELNKNTRIELFRVNGATNFSFSAIKDTDGDQFNLNPSFLTDNGKVLYLSTSDSNY